jgi:hypothetical protein
MSVNGGMVVVGLITRAWQQGSPVRKLDGVDDRVGRALPPPPQLSDLRQRSAVAVLTALVRSRRANGPL